MPICCSVGTSKTDSGVSCDVCEHAVNLREKKIGEPGKTVEVDKEKIGYRKQNKGSIVEGT